MDITTDAQRMLLAAAAADSDIMVLPVLAGTIIQAGGEEFLGIDDGRREEARWKHAVAQLESAGYIEPLGYKREVFALTHSGFQEADRLHSSQISQ